VSLPCDVDAVAQKLIAAVATLCRVGESELALTASIGISLYPDDGQSIDSLIGLADAAMYRAKRNGPGSYAFHGRDVLDGRAPATPGAAPAAARLKLPAAPPPRLASLADCERRNAELREANDQLVLAALGAQELQAAAQRARQRQAECLALVAQEVGDPQAPIRLASAMFGRASADEPLLPRLQTLIEQQAQHMSRLVGAVQDVGHAEAGTLRLAREPLELVDLIKSTATAFGAQMQARQQRFEACWPTSTLTLLGDRARLAQIVGKLLDNASKYTPQGGEIGLALELTAGAAVLTVSDNGIGITAQALADIFDPFVQDTLALGFNGVGRGIGLTVVRSLVEAHGGTVRAYSDGAALGSRFVVSLPGARLAVV
jgi:diguanylate cyclase